MPGMSQNEPDPAQEPKLDLPPPTRYGYVGRRRGMAGLQRAFQRAPVALLTGPAGIGKTELACGFARWLADKGHSPGGAFFTAFVYGAGLCRVIHEIGTTLRGISFARLPWEQQRQWIISYLRENPCLLIWDNFENALKYLLDPTETRELLDFLKDLGDGPSRVLITGRSDPTVASMLSQTLIKYRREHLDGMSDPEAGELATSILGAARVAQDSLGHDYGKLQRLLQGNPMAMTVMLPHLKHHDASELAGKLHHLAEEEPDVLDLALQVSFSLLSPRTRTHLPFLTLFHQRLLLDVYTFITQSDVYEGVAGERMGWGACRALLREARDNGLVDAVSPSVYMVHPVVSQFLRRELERRLTPSQIDILEEEFVRVYTDLGDYFLERLPSSDADSTVTGVLAEEPNLLRALQLAESRAQWDRVQLILQPLVQVYQMQERVLESARLRDRVLASIGHEAAEAGQRGAIDLWAYLTGTEIGTAISRGELDRAEAACHALLPYLESSHEAPPQERVASVYHNLGMIGQGRGDHDVAERWFNRSLAINESIGNEAEAADCYHQLGLIARSRHQYEDAERWHQRALAVRERLEDEAEAASEWHHLALVAEDLRKLPDAAERYERARAGYESAGNRTGVAATCYRLGTLAQARFEYEEATGWYLRALDAYEELGDAANGADERYQLGTIALRTYGYEEAEEWLQQAVLGFQQQGNDGGVAGAYHQLGVVAHSQKRYDDAEDWYQKAVDTFVGLGDEGGAAGSWGQLGLLADQRGDYSDAIWYLAHTYEIARDRNLPVLPRVRTHLSHLLSKMGAESFARCWEEVSDSDVISELS